MQSHRGRGTRTPPSPLPTVETTCHPDDLVSDALPANLVLVETEQEARKRGGHGHRQGPLGAGGPGKRWKARGTSPRDPKVQSGHRVRTSGPVSKCEEGVGLRLSGGGNSGGRQSQEQTPSRPAQRSALPCLQRSQPVPCRVPEVDDGEHVTS